MILAVFPLEMSVSRQCFDGMTLPCTLPCIAAIASLQSVVMAITTSVVLGLTTKASECFSGCFYVTASQLSKMQAQNLQVCSSDQNEGGIQSWVGSKP